MPTDAERPGRATYTVLLVGSMLLLGAVLVPLWSPLLLAAVLAGAIAGPQRWLTRRLKGRRRLAAGITMLGLLLLVLAPLGLLVTYLVLQAIDLVQRIAEFLQAQGIEGVVALAPDRFEPFLREQAARLPKTLSASASRIASQGAAAVGAVGAAVSRTSALVFDAVVMLIALYFLLVDGPALMRWVRSVSPLGARRTGELFEEVRKTATAVLSSTVATAAVQAVIATTGYFIARVPAPLVFGFITFLAAFIPSVGTAAVGVPIAIVLLLTGHYLAGGFLLGWMLLVAGTVDNVLKPYLARGGAGLHGSVVFFSMIGGILAFGGLGLIIGPSAVTFFVALVRLGRQELAERALPGERPAPPPEVGPEGEPVRPH